MAKYVLETERRKLVRVALRDRSKTNFSQSSKEILSV